MGGLIQTTGSAFQRERDKAMNKLAERILARVESACYREECKRAIPKSSGGTGEGIPNQLSHAKTKGLREAHTIITEELQNATSTQRPHERVPTTDRPSLRGKLVD